eukprot:TRINITY_DN1915_c0_g1_i1.p1 TRINITY_DN1915_c0_g1~~TRINITY_DN1915_c0_g1_i1.p1  ORF type:complete len:286 (-),score=42.17 TRINITY_DN1915_c0_g1_i1:252-1109(-)
MLLFRNQYSFKMICSSSQCRPCAANRNFTKFPNLTKKHLKCSANLQADKDIYRRDDNSRRNLLGGLALFGAAAPFIESIPSAQAAVKKTVQVGNYLPDGSLEGFSLFVPDAKKTPALRAGTVDSTSPYKFELPSSWEEGKVANIQSGNYCQPRCDEPWTEVIFGNPDEGKVQVIVSPLRKLTNKANARIEEIGTPEGLINSLGPYVTGTYLDEEDIVSIKQQENSDGRTYYYYEIFAPYGTVGPHTLTCASTKGDLALLAVISANDKQWAKNKDKLRSMIQTFRV